ncbi:Glyoxalase/Bleomycin resistance protein/Dihydroxybiphenyl dioxygenase [Aspergillus pseudodeflectus]|uniref:Glyoxalase/Bleomycin resistance protein/Dihydroxybiphenyl dioxygenase n=1 Tax=Aspergillus pseudodeflectus TaxID=176178 RepID=A0ABR4KU25_9EURO
MEFDPNSEFVPSSKIDHIGINAPTEEFESLVEFYKKALAPLKYKELMRFPGAVGLGDQVPDFWISETKDQTKQNVHFAFVSNDRKTVDAFHEAAIAAGGSDNGKPGLRTEYHPNYYASFIIDPRGNNVEIVCHLPAKQ